MDKRTDLYFLQTDDMGRTWKNAAGEPVAVPLTEPKNPALVREYSVEGRLVYIHDIDLDGEGNPVILYVTSADFKPGPSGEPRWWTVARWTGGKWRFADVAPANHNYSTGSLYLSDDAWRIIGPIERGPQPIGGGGEVAIWISRDKGESWGKERGADFMLLGEVNTIIDREGGDEVKFYQVDTYFVNLEDNTKAWVGQTKIKKFVGRHAYKP